VGIRQLYSKFVFLSFLWHLTQFGIICDSIFQSFRKFLHANLNIIATKVGEHHWWDFIHIVWYM
jgi:hypothetical protein